MKTIFSLKLLFIFNIVLALLSCNSSKLSFDDIQNKVYNNDFKFVVNNFENRKTFSVPTGTGRILSSNTPIHSDQLIGIVVNHNQLTINLPVDNKDVELNMTSIKVISQDFTVARRSLDNGNLLLNFFLNDQKEFNLVKMEIKKNGIIDCTVEGDKIKPLFYTGNLE